MRVFSYYVSIFLKERPACSIDALIWFPAFSHIFGIIQNVGKTHFSLKKK